MSRKKERQLAEAASESRQALWWAAAAAAGLAALILFLNWNSLAAPFERDEGEYSYCAWLLRTGGLPYRDYFTQKPPLIIYTYLLGQLLSPQALWPPRLLALLFLAGSALLLGLIARRRWGTGAGWAAAWTFVPLMALPGLASFAANTERFMLLPLTAALAAHSLRRDDISAWPWFWSGGLGALALAYKPIALPVLLVLFSVWAWEVRGQGGRAMARGLASAALGGAAAAVLVLAYFAWRGALAEVWEGAVRYNGYYAAALGGGAQPLLQHLGKLGSQAWPAAALLGLSLLVRPPGWKFLWALALAALAAVYRAQTGHYYILLVPLAALLCGAALDRAAAWVSGRRPGPHRLALAGGVALVLWGLCWPIRGRFLMSGTQLVAETYFGNPFVESVAAARRLAELTGPDDPVFLAGSEPQILFYAGRRSATRFPIVYSLTIPTPLAAGYQEQAVAQLRSRPPKAVVYSSSPLSWLAGPRTPPLFMDYLRALLAPGGGYRAVGAYLPDAGRWVEPVDSAQLSSASLVLFLRD